MMNSELKLNDMGTTGLAQYVHAGKNGRACNLRRMHAERVLSKRYQNSSLPLVIERFRNLISTLNITQILQKQQ